MAKPPKPPKLNEKPDVFISDANATEGEDAVFTVNLSVAYKHAVTVTYTIDPATAVVGDDYTPIVLSVVIPAGQTSAVIPVPTVEDGVVEQQEQFTANLVSATADTDIVLNITDAIGVATIADDDHAPVAANDMEYAIEGINWWNWRDMLGGDTDADGDGLHVTSVTHNGITYDLPEVGGSNVIQIPGGHFVASSSGAFIYARDDGTMEDGTQLTETFTYTVTDDHGNTDTGEMNVLVAAKPQISISDVTLDENGSPGVFTVSLANPFPYEIQLGFELLPSAAALGDDFTIQGTTTILPGQTSATLSVSPIDDAQFEGDEQFTVLINQATAILPNGQIPLDVMSAVVDAQGVGTIVDNDPPLTISGPPGGVVVTEGVDGIANLPITLNHAHDTDLLLEWQTIPGSAVAGEDFVDNSGSVVIPAGQTSAVIAVPIVDDEISEDTESFNVLWTTNGGMNIFDSFPPVTIVDNEPPLPAFSVGDVSVNETDGTGAFTITRSGNTDIYSGVQLQFASGTAIDGYDFWTNFGPGASTSFDPGVTSQTIEFHLWNDGETESDEHFMINLLNPTNATIADNQGVATILANDPIPLPTMTIGDVTVTEGDALATFNVSLSHAYNEDLDLYWATVDGSASAPADYVGGSQPFTIPAGQTGAVVQVPIADDAELESAETFQIVVFEADAGTPKFTEFGTATIVDNEVPLEPLTITVAADDFRFL